jgi:uncharacterized protein
MSANIKGTRRRSPSVIRELKIGNFKVPFGVVIILLFAALYLVCLIGSKMESGSDALTLQVASFAIFALFAYAVRKNILQLKPFIKIIDIFLGLSLIPILWDLAQFFGRYDTTKPLDVNGLATIGVVNLILSVAIVAMVLYYEKGKLSETYVRSGNIRAGIITGLAGLGACIILALAAAYFFFNANVSNIGEYLPVLATLCVFSLAAAFTEELWFRGVLLARIIPLVGLNVSLLITAAIFAIFEAVIAFTLMPQAFFVLVVLIAAMISGYYWGRITVQNNSILGSTLFHTGFYLLMALPIIFK